MYLRDVGRHFRVTFLQERLQGVEGVLPELVVVLLNEIQHIYDKLVEMLAETQTGGATENNVEKNST